MTAPAPVLVWFRRDLRLQDNPALSAAARTRQPVLPVFVLPEDKRDGAASAWWLHHSLAALQQALLRKGARLLLTRGRPAERIARIAADTGAASIFYNRAYEPVEVAEESELAGLLPPRVSLRPASGNVLWEPGSICSGSGAPFRMFTPFWRRCLRDEPPGAPVRLPSRWAPWKADYPGERLDDWRLCPRQPDWAADWPQRWQPGERGALEALEELAAGPLQRYAIDRDRADVAGTSRLSPHLHFGEISVRQVWHALQEPVDGGRGGTEAFLRQIGWREFSVHLLHAFPRLGEAPLRAQFQRFPWRKDGRGLRRWQQGATGYPLVDAGMRQLWATGWMHNRVRMVTASFLVKHLLIDWREGATWFMDTLVDADLASNANNWQWVAGTGTDAAPFFRVFNPVLQGRKFDPEGHYVRRWVPELGRLPLRYLHSPWTAPARVLEAAGVRLGKTYPAPLVDHPEARKRALAAYAAVRAR